ncbi:MAG: gfo/Idh/MocA family oxidoreductase [Bacteroidetes bacterium]|nr:MAG: gfo/Idh/MocA family oxidoreductase [Bacteroidota bacterium]REK05159.1 MAG: gfo/Idh/MocA family oxidoreductase [Bacteroidota bacterium]REK32564.1 MAG: gfo/Idh/MocA family oxidoreductase [Bacteroidota bacterium]REK48989.1 MAG: gfo/Idh/MocA family oxidoreductase [Bacteroidota bacterium]
MIDEKQKVRFAIVGAGHIGKRHAEMIRRNPEAELVAMCDIKSKADLKLDEFDVPFFNSYDELLNSDISYDVISIASPNGLHAEQTLKALEKRKHVVIEKPMALTVADCEKIIFKALQVSRQVFCVMQNRYSPPSLWIKNVVESKTLGKVYMVQLNCYWNRDDRYYTGKNWKGTPDLDGGTLFTQFSHFIDIMYWLFGDITDIQGKFRDFNHSNLTAFEDSGFVNFNFVNGGMGCINYSTCVWDKNLESSMTIIGEKGSIKIGGQYMNEVEYCHIKDYEMPELPPVSPANDYGHYKGSAANHHFIIENVIDTLKGRTSATTNALEGLKVVDIIERIYSLRNLKKLQNHVRSMID